MFRTSTNTCTMWCCIGTCRIPNIVNTTRMTRALISSWTNPARIDSHSARGQAPSDKSCPSAKSPGTESCSSRSWTLPQIVHTWMPLHRHLLLPHFEHQSTDYCNLEGLNLHLSLKVSAILQKVQVFNGKFRQKSRAKISLPFTPLQTGLVGFPFPIFGWSSFFSTFLLPDISCLLSVSYQNIQRVSSSFLVIFSQFV